MKFNLEIECNNLAFLTKDGCGADEVARILRETAQKLDEGHRQINLRDFNGNRVGIAQFTKENT